MISYQKSKIKTDQLSGMQTLLAGRDGGHVCYLRGTL